jgi:hypothetical protein
MCARQQVDVDVYQGVGLCLSWSVCVSVTELLFEDVDVRVSVRGLTCVSFICVPVSLR